MPELVAHKVSVADMYALAHTHCSVWTPRCGDVVTLTNSVAVACWCVRKYVRAYALVCVRKKVIEASANTVRILV